MRVRNAVNGIRRSVPCQGLYPNTAKRERITTQEINMSSENKEYSMQVKIYNPNGSTKTISLDEIPPPAIGRGIVEPGKIIVLCLLGLDEWKADAEINLSNEAFVYSKNLNTDYPEISLEDVHRRRKVDDDFIYCGWMNDMDHIILRDLTTDQCVRISNRPREFKTIGGLEGEGFLSMGEGIFDDVEDYYSCNNIRKRVIVVDP